MRQHCTQELHTEQLDKQQAEQLGKQLLMQLLLQLDAAGRHLADGQERLARSLQAQAVA